MWGSLFLLIALVFSRSIQVQFTLPKLLVLRTFARLLRSAASIVIVSAVFPIATYREVRADGLHFEMLGLDPSRDWARIEQAVDASLEIAQGDSYYLDAAGLQYLKRLQVTGRNRPTRRRRRFSMMLRSGTRSTLCADSSH